jgi:uncharacterized protein YndB with AHSA1/START domain
MLPQIVQILNCSESRTIGEEEDVIEIARERQLPSPPGELWPLVSDAERLGEWFAFADSAEVIDGAPGVGQRRRMHGHWGKRKSEIDQRVTDWEPPRRIGWEHQAERLDGKPAPRFAAETLFTIELDPAGAGGSRVRLTSRQRPASRPRGLVIRLFGGREIGGKLGESLERLDQLTSRSLPDSTS